MDFANKKVLITGSGQGIGRSTARAFLEEGAVVAVNDRTAQAVDVSIASLGGVRLHPAPGDIATVAGCQQAVASALEGLGGLDILVNNAGVYREASIEGTDETLWDLTLDVNLKGMFFTTQSALPALRESKGVVVNLASESGLVGNPLVSAYCASKAGVIGLTRALAMELAPDIRVNCVCPAVVDTDLFREPAEATGDPDTYYEGLRHYAPLRRLARPEEIAKAILYLASADAAFITGSPLIIDGGVTAGP